MSANNHSQGLRQILSKAKQGDYASFLELRMEGRTNRDLYRRTLSLIPPHLRVLPPGNNPTHRYLAITALGTLDDGLQVWEKDQHIQLALVELLTSHTKDVLRWMGYLFNQWVYDYDSSDNESIMNAFLDNLLDTDNLLETIRALIPCLMRRMVEHNDVLDQMKDDEQVGPLLVRLIISGARDSMNPTIRYAKRIRYKLMECSPGCLDQCPSPRWKSDYLQSLKDLSTDFAPAFFDPLPAYGADLSQHIIPFAEVMVLLMDCLGDEQEHLPYVCFKHKDAIRALVTMFQRNIELWLKRQEHDTGWDKDVSLPTISCTVVLLNMSLVYGGPSAASLAIDHGLLDTLSMLRMRPSASPAPDDVTQKIDQLESSVVELVGRLISFIIYPRVFKKAFRFCDKDNLRTLNEASRLKKVDEILVRLVYRLHSEIEVRQTYGVQGAAPQDSSSPESSPKFCDNAECPLAGKFIKLGRCVGCFSSYYCSRSCQKVVWKNEHRNECATIAASRSEFPTALTTHDREYFRRTMVSRFKQWKTPLDPAQRPSIATACRLRMDLTGYPLQLEVLVDRRSKRGIASDLHEAQAPVSTTTTIKAKIATCKKLGNVVWVAAELPAELLN